MESEPEPGVEGLRFPDLDGADLIGESEGCQLCGWQPAAEVSLRRQVAWLISRRVESVDGRLCRACGQSAYRSMTNRTLLTGWWGLVSFFANFVHVGRNLLAGRKLRGLDSPHTPPTDGEEFLPGPLDAGKPLSLRSGPWVVGLLVLLVIGGGVSASLSSAQRDDGGALSRSGTLDVTELQEGDCFDDPEGVAEEVEILEVQAVVCAEQHDNEVYEAGSLPGSDDSYPGDDALFQQVGARCVAEFETFVGVPYEDSVLDFAVLTPTGASWEAGDRDYACAIFDPSRPVEGSLRGSNR